jgi:hypothetical protein
MPKNPKVSSKCRNKVDRSDKKLSKIGQEDAVLSIDLKKSSRASNTSKKMGLSPKSKAVHKKLGKVFPLLLTRWPTQIFCNVDLYLKYLQQISIKYFVFTNKERRI